MKKCLLWTILLAIAVLTSCQNPSAKTDEKTVKNENISIPVGNANQTPTPKVAETVTPPILVMIDGKQSELIPAKQVIPELVEDLKYATADNFMKRKLYNDPKCYLLKDTAQHLALAQKELSSRKPNYKLKVWDCYRPMNIQQEMWKEYTNTPYVANPKTARHPRGRAVDITIVDETGKELEMPTAHDDFSSKAHPNAPTTQKAAANRELLRTVMLSVGFSGVNSEWWHFDYLVKNK